MSWVGKIAGGVLGATIGGPLAGLLSMGIGHQLDRELDGFARTTRRRRFTSWQQCWDTSLFRAEFSLAGFLARIGDFSPESRITAFDILAGRRGLIGSERDEAQMLFRDGLRPDFPLTKMINDVRRELHRRPDLTLHLLMTLLLVNRITTASTDAHRDALLEITRRLGLSDDDLVYLEQVADTPNWQSGARGGQAMDLSTAYTTLGIATQTSEAEVRRAYRRLMSRHHPDKLVHEHPSAEHLAEAATRTDRIRKAYVTVRAARGWK